MGVNDRSRHLLQFLRDDGLQILKRKEAFDDSLVDVKSGYDLDAHAPGFLAGVYYKGPVFVAIEAPAEGSHVQVQLLGKAIQLLSGERSFEVIK